MPLTAAQTELYGSAVMPEDEVTLNIGGAIDPATLISFTRLLANSTLEVLSDNIADTTMSITVTGRAADGTLLTDTVALNGTTAVNITGTFKRLLKAVLSAPAAGTVTLRKSAAGGDAMIFPPGVTTLRRPFINAAADVAAGSARVFYEKLFFKNTSGIDALIAAQVALGVNPGNKYKFALAVAVDGVVTNGAGNNRAVAPAALVFDAAQKAVPGADLLPGTAIGVWVELTLAAGLAAGDEEFRLDLSGTTN